MGAFMAEGAARHTEYTERKVGRLSQPGGPGVNFHGSSVSSVFRFF